MNQQTMDIAERYVHATRGQMYFDLTYSSRSDRAEKSAAAAQDIGQYRPPLRPVSVKSRDLLVICAAGMANHWGTRLWRLKYGHDSSEFRPVLERFQKVAVATSRRLNWDDDEQAHFFARFVLLGWLLDRAFHGKGEWKRRCIVLRQQLFSAEREAARLLALKLGH